MIFVIKSGFNAFEMLFFSTVWFVYKLLCIDKIIHCAVLFYTWGTLVSWDAGSIHALSDENVLEAVFSRLEIPDLWSCAQVCQVKISFFEFMIIGMEKANIQE